MMQIASRPIWLFVLYLGSSVDLLHHRLEQLRHGESQMGGILQKGYPLVSSLMVNF